MKAILFDLDGTLHDSEWAASASYELALGAALGRPLTAEEKLFLVGKPIADILAEWFPGQDQAILADVFRHYETMNGRITAYEGVMEMLAGLQGQGVRLGIVSSKRRRFVLSELENSGLAPFFPVVVTYDDCTEHKPSPLPLRQAADAMGVDPADCLYVGDQPTDLLAAHAAGMPSAAALWGEGQVERLAQLSPAFTLHAPADVLHVQRAAHTA